MKDKKYWAYSLFFAMIFVLLAFAMHSTVIQGLHQNDHLSVGVALIFIGPLSLAALAICLSAAKVVVSIEQYKIIKLVIGTLASIQLISTVVYLVLI